jgi:hypothetical protein
MTAKRVRVAAGPRVHKRLLLAVPSYGHLDPTIEKDLRVAIMVAARHGVEWVGDASPDRMAYSTARNLVAQACIDTPDCDGVMWIDADVKVPASAIWKLMLDAEAHNAEFVTGIYYQREGACFPLIAQYNPEKHRFSYYTEWQDDVMAPADGCGFGFCYTAKTVLQKIAALPGFNERERWFPDTRDVEGGLGEDFNFCVKARQAGVQLWVTTAVQLGHGGGPEIITREHFVAAREKREKTEGAA